MIQAKVYQEEFMEIVKSYYQDKYQVNFNVSFEQYGKEDDGKRSCEPFIFLEEELGGEGK